MKLNLFLVIGSAALGLVGCDRAERAPRPQESLAPSAQTLPQVAAASVADDCDPAAFDGLLRTYVHEGRVDYEKLTQSADDRKTFEAYLARVGRCDSSKLAPGAHYAFWVNAYNAFNIKGVLDAFPVTNIKSVPGFLDKKTYLVAGKTLTLNDMEYKQLIPPHKDARAHFAVVCADLGSVPLDAHAYTPETLESSLERKASEFAKDGRNLQVDRAAKRVIVSMLFSPEWYEKDFLADPRFKGKRAVEYLAPYVDKETADFLRSGDYKVEFAPWDWSLNAVTAKKSAP